MNHMHEPDIFNFPAALTAVHLFLLSSVSFLCPAPPGVLLVFSWWPPGGLLLAPQVRFNGHNLRSQLPLIVSRRGLSCHGGYLSSTSRNW